MDKPVYVIGHKNPDADSICSAIAYSALKNKLGINTVAARLSAVNKETLYILDRFRLPVPMLLTSAKCTLAEIDMDEAMLLSKDTTMKEALDAIHFKLPFAKVTPWVVLAFLALVVVLMCFSASYRVAVIAGVIWLAILFAAYQITQAKR